MNNYRVAQKKSKPLLVSEQVVQKCANEVRFDWI